MKLRFATLALAIIISSMSMAQTEPAATKTKIVTKTKSTTKPVAKKQIVKPAASDKMTPVAGTTKVKITTDSGVIVVVLYDSTPLHRDNFIRLVSQKFYDSLLFHRVIPTFMIQGGDPTSKNAPAGEMLGMGGDNIPRIPAEIRTSLFHKRGALAAARDNNPEKASSGCQFYIVQGKVFSKTEMDMMIKSGMKLSQQAQNAYTTIGGSPWLDNQYTVFGEVISGAEVIDKIANAPRDSRDRPNGDIHMYMEIVR